MDLVIFVVATQNPVQFRGTCPLSEALAMNVDAPIETNLVRWRVFSLFGAEVVPSDGLRRSTATR